MPELLPPEVELPPYGGKATSGLRMLRAEPCLSTSFQSRDELPEVPDIVDKRLEGIGLGVSGLAEWEEVRL